MTSNVYKLHLLAALAVATALPGCSIGELFKSPTSDYRGEYCKDVSDLPDPNAPPVSKPEKRLEFVDPTIAQLAGGGAAIKESPERLLAQADGYYEQEKFHDAARLYKKYLATPEAANASPDVLGRAHYRIGVVASKRLNFKEAQKEYRIALQAEPQNSEYCFALALASYKGRDYAAADANFASLLARDPNYPEAQYYYGLTLLEGKRRADAIAPLTAAVGALKANAMLTDKYYQLGKLELAAESEAKTAQIAASLGNAVPAFPHKPAADASQAVQAVQVAQNVPNLQTAQNDQNDRASQTATNAVEPKDAIGALPTTNAPIATTNAPLPTVQTASNDVVPARTVETDGEQIAETVGTTEPKETPRRFASRLAPRLASVDSKPAPVAPTSTAIPTEQPKTNPVPSSLLLPALARTLAAATDASETPTETIAATPSSVPETTETALPIASSVVEESLPVAPVVEESLPIASSVGDPLPVAPVVEESLPVAPVAEESLSIASSVDETLPTAPLVDAGLPVAPLAATPFDDETPFVSVDANANFEFSPEFSPEFDAPAPLVAEERTVDAATKDDGSAVEPSVEPIVEAVVAPVVPEPVRTANVGRRNPGLFAASSAPAFRPGSIAAETSNAPASDSNSDSANPQIARLAPVAENALAPNAQTSVAETLDARRFAVDYASAARYVESFDALEIAVDLFRARDDFQTANDEDAFDEDEDFAFASSGSSAPQTAKTPESVPAPLASTTPNLGSFAGYEAPSAQSGETGESAETAARTFAQTPIDARLGSTSPITPAPQATPTRSRMTPEEKLRAAVAAGAEVKELSPEQYRKAVAAGLGKSTTTR